MVPVAEWCGPVVATEDGGGDAVSVVLTEVPTGGTTVDGTPVETPGTPVEGTPTEETVTPGGVMLEGSPPVGLPGTLIGGAGGALPEVVGIPGGGTTGGAVLQVSTVTVTVAVTVLHSSVGCVSELSVNNRNGCRTYGHR